MTKSIFKENLKKLEPSFKELMKVVLKVYKPELSVEVGRMKVVF